MCIRDRHLTFAIVAVFILFPASRKSSKMKTPWYDWLLAAAAGGVTGYIVFFFNDIARRGAEPIDYEIYPVSYTHLDVYKRQGRYSIRM